MKIDGGLRVKLSFYLKQLEEQKGNKEAIRILKIILDESVSEAFLRKEISQLENIVKASENHQVLEIRHLLGISRQFGLGTEKDLKIAVELYKAASSEGLPRAQYHLGVCYMEGQGVEKDLERAVTLFKSVEEQCVEAMNYLGYCYQFGIIVEIDLKEATKRYQKAANNGWAAAQTNIGRCYETGSFVPENPALAVKFYQLASIQGWAAGQTCLGYCLQRGYGITEDRKAAIELYQLAIAQDSDDARTRLGRCYVKGIGVSVNLKQAVALFQKAAERGDLAAKCNLGQCFAEGQGVSKDSKRAAELFQQAACDGHGEALYHLGKCYQWGFGVIKNLDRAALLFQAAIEAGQSRAQIKLNELELAHPELEFPVLEDVQSHYTELLSDKNAEIADNALSTLAFARLMGLGIKQNFNKATGLYSLAFSKNCPGILSDLVFLCRQSSSGYPWKKENFVELYERLNKPFTHNLKLEGERIACRAYICENGAPNFDQDLFEAHKHYQTISEQSARKTIARRKSEREVKISAEEAGYAQMKQGVFTYLYDIYLAIDKTQRELCFPEHFSKKAAPGLIASLVTEYLLGEEHPTVIETESESERDDGRKVKKARTASASLRTRR